MGLVVEPLLCDVAQRGRGDARLVLGSARTSWSVVITPRGTATDPSTAATRARTASTILRVMLGLAEPEPAAVDRLDQARFAELAAQRRDVDVQYLRRAVPVRIPRALQVISWRPTTRPAIGNEDLEDVEFLGREHDLRAGHGDTIRVRMSTTSGPCLTDVAAWANPAQDAEP